jgi:peptidoglycan-N-acetylglucosamine deacetylase
MDRKGTWAAAGTVAVGVASIGNAIDRRLGTAPLATTAGAAAAGLYLAGTFCPKVRIFGSPADVVTSENVLALTFDDGPDPRYTLEISRMLAERGHQATFFVLARATRAHPTIAAAVAKDGHDLACHGDDHGLLAFATPREVRRQIAATENAAHEATGIPLTRLFRAPHGIRSPWLSRVVESCGYHLCAWDGAVFDTAGPGSQAIAKRVERLLRPGAIVLLHDGDGSGRGSSRQQTLDALPAILDAAEHRGLRSVRLCTLVE